MNISNPDFFYNTIEALTTDADSIRKMATYVKEALAAQIYESTDFDDVVGDIEEILIVLKEATFLLESAVDNEVFGDELKRLGCPCIGCPAESECDIEDADQCVSWQQWFDNLEDIPMGDADE